MHCNSFTHLASVPDIAPVSAESQPDNDAYVVAFMRRQPLGACVKIFGINHQLLGIDFRNANDDTSRTIAGKLLLEPPRP